MKWSQEPLGQQDLGLATSELGVLLQEFMCYSNFRRNSVKQLVHIFTHSEQGLYKLWRKEKGFSNEFTVVEA